MAVAIISGSNKILAEILDCLKPKLFHKESRKWVVTTAALMV
jgi:hypothetical protein